MARPKGSLGKDNMCKYINIRLKEKQIKFVENQCKMLDIKISDYIRMLVSLQMGLQQEGDNADKFTYIDD